MEDLERNIINNIFDMVSLADVEGNLKFLSPSHKKLGYDLDQMVGWSIFDIVHPDDLERLKTAFADYIRELKDTGIVEYRAICADGSVLWLESFGKLLFDEDDRLEEVLISTRDVTARKKVEDALKESEARNRAFIKANPDVMFVYNQKGVIVDYKASDGIKFMDLPEKILGKDISQVFPPDMAKRVAKHLQKIFVTQEMQINELKLDLDGEERFYESRLVPYGKSSALDIVRDITERKMHEKKLEYLSLHDQLSGLYNRAYAEEKMERLILENKLPISIIMADVNGLKLVNDSYGYSVGDEMLKNVAKILRSACREDDIVARWGGDEFVFILPQTTEEEVMRICKEIKCQISENCFKEIPLSVALGVSVKNDPERGCLMALKAAENNMFNCKLSESRSTKSILLNSMLNALEAKSFEKGEHVGEMLKISKKFAEKLKLSGNEFNRLNMAIKLHDIGKINISKDILTKTDPLTEGERKVLRKHPEIGYRIAIATTEYSHVAREILAHHERWDGSGYPEGLKERDIPYLARVLSIIDAYEVMLSGRPYKNPMPKEEVIAELKRCSGTQFDPELIEKFLEVYSML